MIESHYNFIWCSLFNQGFILFHLRENDIIDVPSKELTDEQWRNSQKAW